MPSLLDRALNAGEAKKFRDVAFQAADRLKDTLSPWLRLQIVRAALHAGDGATNQLRVVTKGSLASLYVNGEKFKDISGQPPEKGQEIGLIAYSPKKGPATYAFDNVKITPNKKD